MNYLKEAQSHFDEMLATRRHLHQNPETGFETQETAKFIKKKLKEYGLEPEDIGENGVTALIGPDTGKTILLRADMDALPIKEESGVEFASKNDYMHACGHDMHTTVLLTAARLLKENEDQLKGHVKFIFQPAEELLIGGKAMVDAGILENPKVDVALGLHVAPNIDEQGILVVEEGPWMTFANNFRIRIKGEGAHGATPYLGVDPVMIGAQIVNGAQEILSRELPFDRSATLTMGKFIAKGAINVIPGEAVIEGTVRGFSNESKDYIKKRLPEIVQKIAEAYRGSAEFELLSDCPVLVNDGDFSRTAISYLKEISQGEFDIHKGGQVHASEDFAYYADQVPAFFFNILTPNPDAEDGKLYPVHHPKVVFGEEILPKASAMLSHIATRWLEDQA
ncbi:Uncharacterized hydrolase YxeP [Alloiococcus otitis]|uniref:Amidohydrolase n=1 Tax=Alloiococcus otitis ATCC 51267 TaxID=883081 RepID=K9EVC9_9LACT|nr:M20 family metallopeptidase [Alloiococcus otitis]EKU93180.1 amidohydrolase [Alloiococcus otitis ATCC 51267]SUU80518.1 Uncharacterized hydrolase YxeP [Alloiococcus otitis]